MANTNNFTPSIAGTKTVSATATNTSTALNAADASSQCLLVTNAGANPVFINWQTGGTCLASVTTGTPILNGMAQVFTIGFADTIGLICNSAQTATVYLTPGEGQ